MNDPDATASPQTRHPIMTRPDGSPVRALVVDDEASLAEVLAGVLRFEGWEVRTAGDGADAIRTARELRPDAVLLDVMLPDMGGLDVLRRLRRGLRGRAAGHRRRGHHVRTADAAAPAPDRRDRHGGLST